MTEDSLDYLWNPDAPADWFVKFPLKVSFIPAPLVSIQINVGNEQICLILIVFLTIAGMC